MRRGLAAGFPLHSPMNNTSGIEAFTGTAIRRSCEYL
jgi:hypothetical protein